MATFRFIHSLHHHHLCALDMSVLANIFLSTSNPVYREMAPVICLYIVLFFLSLQDFCVCHLHILHQLKFILKGKVTCNQWL